MELYQGFFYSSISHRRDIVVSVWFLSRTFYFICVEAAQNSCQVCKWAKAALLFFDSNSLHRIFTTSSTNILHLGHNEWVGRFFLFGHIWWIVMQQSESFNLKSLTISIRQCDWILLCCLHSDPKTLLELSAVGKYKQQLKQIKGLEWKELLKMTVNLWKKEKC